MLSFWYLLDIDTVVYTAKATDLDVGTNGEIRYEIYQVADSRHSTGRFAIDQMTGEVKVVNRLNFEETSRHIITIKAQDQGTVVQRYGEFYCIYL